MRPRPNHPNNLADEGRKAAIGATLTKLGSDGFGLVPVSSSPRHLGGTTLSEPVTSQANPPPSRVTIAMGPAGLGTVEPGRPAFGMSRQDAFERILASLHEAMLDDEHWLVTSALVDEACRTKGNHLVFSHQSSRGIEIFFTRFCYRGEHRTDREREYFREYYPVDVHLPATEAASGQQDRPHHRNLLRTGA